jgi:hypothetical protein
MWKKQIEEIKKYVKKHISLIIYKFLILGVAIYVFYSVLNLGVIILNTDDTHFQIIGSIWIFGILISFILYLIFIDRWHDSFPNMDIKKVE